MCSVLQACDQRGACRETVPEWNDVPIPGTTAAHGSNW